MVGDCGRCESFGYEMVNERFRYPLSITQLRMGLQVNECIPGDRETGGVGSCHETNLQYDVSPAIYMILIVGQFPMIASDHSHLWYFDLGTPFRIRTSSVESDRHAYA
jgi:hypothetical protein